MTQVQAWRRPTRRACVAGAFACVAGASPIAASAAPSFDCTDARTRVEHMICEDPALAKLDQRIADIYFALLETAPPTQATEIRQQQRDFLRQRDLCTSMAGLPSDCVASSLRMRLEDLQLLHAELSGTPLVSGGTVTTAPGIVWRAARPGMIDADSFRLADGDVLCAVGLPDQPVIGTAGDSLSDGCTIARDGTAASETAFYVLVAGTAEIAWRPRASMGEEGATPIDAWRDDDTRIQACRATIDGTGYVGTYTVGDACTVLVGRGSAFEEMQVLARFEVLVLE